MLSTIFNELYNLNRDFSNYVYGDYSHKRNIYPKSNVYENEKEFIVSAQLPGVNKEDISITMKDNFLKISGELKKEENESSNYYLKERENGKFERSFVLDEKVEKEKIDAELKNGILLIKIPKSPESKPKKIEIK